MNLKMATIHVTFLASVRTESVSMAKFQILRSHPACGSLYVLKTEQALQGDTSSSPDLEAEA